MNNPATLTTTLTGLTIWDGHHEVDADAIRINAGRISAIGERAEIAPGSHVISCDGATAVPGLIDAHVHLVLDPDASRPPERDALPDLPAMRERAAKMVRAGITSARDLGGGHWLELQLRDDINAGRCPGPRLLCAGQPITSPGGHCHFWGGEAGDAAAVDKVLQRQIQQGVDLIKVMATGGRMTPGSSPRTLQFDEQTLRGIVAAASAAGFPVAAHCHGTEGIAAACDAGVSTIEHCSWAGDGGWGADYQAPVAARLAQRGTLVSPTINRGWRRMIGKPSGERMHTALLAMQALDIPLIASTDAGIPGVYHADLAHALAVFARIAGLGAEAVLRSATSVSAAGLGISDETGSLTVGRAADVLVVDGNPLEDIDALTRPVGVWARGEPMLAP